MKTSRTNPYTKVSNIGAISPASPKDNFWSALFVWLYGMKKRFISLVSALGKPKVSDLRYQVPAFFNINPKSLWHR